MKKFLFIFVAFLISFQLAAQVTDFSGSWKLNRANSKLNDQFSMAPNALIITQKGIDFGLEKHSTFRDKEFTFNDKFTLDGKECINPGWQDSQKKSVATWSDDKKSLKITTKFPMMNNGEMILVEGYKLNGTALEIETAASSSFGEVKEVYVFDKQ